MDVLRLSGEGVERHPGHIFVVLHAPERGARGHVHYIELDQFIGPDWLLTGPSADRKAEPATRSPSHR